MLNEQFRIRLFERTTKEIFQLFQRMPDEVFPPASELESLVLIKFSIDSLFEFEKRQDKKRARIAALRLAQRAMTYLMYFSGDQQEQCAER